MHRTSSPGHAQRLIELVRGAPYLMAALAAVRELDLGAWCIGAGAVRSLVWDSLHGFSEPSALEDIDVVYFDADEPPRLSEAALQKRLSMRMPEHRWEVTNQAHVHHWFRESLGQVVTPLSSLEEGISTWPEFATCVGVSLAADDSIRVLAPHGLEDLFGLRVRHNPVRADAATYRQRVEQKQFARRWPKVEILAAQP